MKVAISGSAGCGKSTLAAALAQRLDLPLIPEMYDGIGMSLKQSTPPRLAAAGFLRILEAKLARQAGLPSCVVDRSPLDLFNLWLQSGLWRQEKESEDFLARCVAGMADFDRVVIPPWNVLQLVRDSTTPRTGHIIRAPNIWVQLANHAAISGLIAMHLPDERILRIPRKLTPAQWLDWTVNTLI